MCWIYIWIDRPIRISKNDTFLYYLHPVAPFLLFFWLLHYLFIIKQTVSSFFATNKKYYPNKALFSLFILIIYKKRNNNRSLSFVCFCFFCFFINELSYFTCFNFQIKPWTASFSYGSSCLPSGSMLKWSDILSTCPVTLIT